MSGNNNLFFLPPFAAVSGGDMGASVTSSVTDIRFLDNIAVQAVWTVGPTGTLYVQASLDQVTWTNLPTSASLTGPAGSILIELNQLASPYIREVFSRTAGTGTLNVLISGKAV